MVALSFAVATGSNSKIAGEVPQCLHATLGSSNGISSQLLKGSGGQHPVRIANESSMISSVVELWDP